MDLSSLTLALNAMSSGYEGYRQGEKQAMDMQALNDAMIKRRMELDLQRSNLMPAKYAGRLEVLSKAPVLDMAVLNGGAPMGLTMPAIGSSAMAPQPMAPMGPQGVPAGWRPPMVMPESAPVVAMPPARASILDDATFQGALEDMIARNGITTDMTSKELSAQRAAELADKRLRFQVDKDSNRNARDFSKEQRDRMEKSDDQTYSQLQKLFNSAKKASDQSAVQRSIMKNIPDPLKDPSLVQAMADGVSAIQDPQKKAKAAREFRSILGGEAPAPAAPAKKAAPPPPEIVRNGKTYRFDPASKSYVPAK